MGADSTSDARIQDLLTRTSRTFALAIPLLPARLRLQVSVAYLLLRVADTIEDAAHLSRAEKLVSLTKLEELLCHGVPDSLCVSDWVPRPPCDDQDCLELLDELPLVMATVNSMPTQARQTIVESICTSIRGMRHFLKAQATARDFELQNIDELRDYCYYVAGIVGEMLTRLFIIDVDRLGGVDRELSRRAKWFGEGLQLVNILKDSNDDEMEGRRFVPKSVRRSAVFELARQDLEHASKYVTTLRQADAPSGIVAFTELPLQLAWLTLECVEQGGPGSKVPRTEVMRILNESLSGSKNATTPSSEVASK